MKASKTYLDRHAESVLQPHRTSIRQWYRVAILLILAFSQKFSDSDELQRHIDNNMMSWHYIIDNWLSCDTVGRWQIWYEVQKKWRELILKICESNVDFIRWNI